MAGTRSVYRIARTMLLALAALLAVGAVGSVLLSVQAINQAKSTAVDQARSIVENSLPIVLSPSDVNSEASDTEADQITVKITPVVLDPTPTTTSRSGRPTGRSSTPRTSSLIGQRPDEARSAVTDATTHGTVSWDQRDGSFSVLVPLHLRSDAPIAAAVQLARPDGPIAAAGRPWQFAAVFMAISAVIAFVLLYKVMRLSASAVAMANFAPASARAAAAAAAMPPVQRPIELPAPGLREEGDARRKAEERAESAEERLAVIQEQYRKTLEQLHVTQKMVQERPQPGAPDPELEGRLLKAEGHARLLEGQLKAMGTERDKLARHIAEQAKNKPDPALDHRARQVEQEAIGLRAELEGAQTELSAHAPGARRTQGPGRARAGDARGSGRRARRSAAHAGGPGVGAGRTRPRQHRAGGRAQRDARAPRRGTEGRRLGRGAPGCPCGAGQPEGVAPRGPGGARSRSGGARAPGPRGVPDADPRAGDAGEAPAGRARGDAHQGSGHPRSGADLGGRATRGGAEGRGRRARGRAPAPPGRARSHAPGGDGAAGRVARVADEPARGGADAPDRRGDRGIRRRHRRAARDAVEAGEERSPNCRPRATRSRPPRMPVRRGTNRSRRRTKS